MSKWWRRLAWIDRPTGQVIRRYERARPGELIHLDIKKVGKIPPGGGWKAHGRGKVKHRRVGCTDLHCAVDDHPRVAYVEAHDNEQAVTLLEFWDRARTWFENKGMSVDGVMSDNGSNFGSRVVAEQLASQAIKHRRTRPYWPQSNGKVERFNRTMADEFVYSFTFRSENQRRRRLDRWIHDYNHHRNHTAVGGPPASRVHNVCGSHSWLVGPGSVIDAVRRARSESQTPPDVGVGVVCVPMACQVFDVRCAATKARDARPRAWGCVCAASRSPEHPQLPRLNSSNGFPRRRSR